MGRDLILYPTRYKESQLPGEHILCLTGLRCHRAGGEFLTQCGVYWDSMDNEDEIPVVLQVLPVPETTHIYLDESDERVCSDRIRPLHYCTAGQFRKIDPSRCDNSPENLAALAYCCALPPDRVVIVYIS